MDNRFMRNIPTLSPEQQTALSNKRVLIVGCGGLGGYINECIVRMGVGHIIAVDGDCFEETNLNRQLLSLNSNLGLNKAQAAKERALEINPEIDYCAVSEFFSAENAEKLMQGADLVIDALDSIEARLILEDECAKRGIVLVHGAISGWNVQVCTVMPGSGILRRIYGDMTEAGDKSCICSTPALCASIQSAEAIKVLCGIPAATENKLLIADMRYMTFDIVQI